MPRLQARRPQRARREHLHRISGPSRTSVVGITLSLILLSAHSTTQAQSFVKNGQFFTKALAIADSPQPGSAENAGSNLVIAVELSGDGVIPQSAFTPGSGLPTRYDSLELYFVSAPLNVNLTVATNPGLLTQEPGSTVKHLNWPMPDCLLPGSYNLTFYESSHVNNNAFFSITPLPVTVVNANVDKNAQQCASNALQPQPQEDFSPSENPYIDPNSGVDADNNTPVTSQAFTITVGSSGLPAAWSLESSGSPVESLTQTTDVLTTATVVVVSLETLTETETGQTLTTTSLVTTTVTAVMATSALASEGFLPVNGVRNNLEPGRFVLWTLCSYLMFWIFIS